MDHEIVRRGGSASDIRRIEHLVGKQRAVHRRHGHRRLSATEETVENALQAHLAPPQ